MIKYRILIGILLFCSMSPIAAVSGTKEQKQETITLRFGGLYNENDRSSRVVTEFARLLKERSGGRVVVELFFNGQLGQEREVVEGVRAGTIDLVHSLGSAFFQYVPAVGVLELPFTARSGAEATEIFLRAMPYVAELAQPKGFYPLTAWDIGGRLLITKTPVRALRDLKGKRVRGPNPLILGTLGALGANPVQMAWGDIYTGLQTGAIDGAEGSPDMIHASKFYEQAKYVTVTNHTIPGFYLLTNNNRWKSFSPELQKIVQQAANDAAKTVVWERTQTVYNEAAQKLKDAGVTFIDPTDGIDAWATAVADFRVKYMADLGPTGTKLAENIGLRIK
jgi:tripartite ATP-independent transporter DctP family solute receptor